MMRPPGWRSTSATKVAGYRRAGSRRSSSALSAAPIPDLPALSHTRKPCKVAGVAVQAFNSTRHLTRRFQINFRNHRKIVVVDGLYAWAGGSNLGDEYLGHDPRYSPWVDTAVKIIGPAAQLLQVPF